jgi:hypothetical protein
LVVALEEHTPMDEAEEFARKTVDILNWYTNELNAITMAAKNRAQIPSLKDVYKEISVAAADGHLSTRSSSLRRARHA